MLSHSCLSILCAYAEWMESLANDHRMDGLIVQSAQFWKYYVHTEDIQTEAHTEKKKEPKWHEL